MTYPPQGVHPFSNFFVGGDQFPTPITYTVTGTGTLTCTVKKILTTLLLGTIQNTLSVNVALYGALMAAASSNQWAGFGVMLRDATLMPTPTPNFNFIPNNFGTTPYFPSLKLSIGKKTTSTPSILGDSIDDQFITVGNSDDYGNVIAAGDFMVLDLVFLQGDAVADTQAITLYSYTYNMNFTIR